MTEQAWWPNNWGQVRIFDYGTLVVNGTGGGKTPVPSVESPLEFRRNAMEEIDASQSKQGVR